MRFSLSSTALSSSLSSLSRVINSKNTMQILDCFLFEIKDGQLVVKTDGEGSFAITSRIILDAVRELPEQPLVFDLNPDDYSVRLNYQNGLFQFMAQADDFPRPVPLSGNVTTIVMDAGQLQEAISRSLFATAQLDSRPVMNGIYFDLTEGCLAIVATDAQKLVRNRMLTVKSDTPASFILPKKPAQLLKQLCLGRDYLPTDRRPLPALQRRDTQGQPQPPDDRPRRPAERPSPRGAVCQREQHAGARASGGRPHRAVFRGHRLLDERQGESDLRVRRSAHEHRFQGQRPDRDCEQPSERRHRDAAGRSEPFGSGIPRRAA